MSDKIEQALEAYRKGDKKQCLQIVGTYLKANPQSERGWLIAAECIDDTDKKRQCYRRVLRINPDNKLAIEELDALDNPAIVCPSCGEQVEDPDLLFCPSCEANLHAQTYEPSDEPERKEKKRPKKLVPKLIIGAFAIFMLWVWLASGGFGGGGGNAVPQSTPSPREEVRQILEDTLGTSNRDVEKIQDMQLKGDWVHITWAIDDNWNANMIRKSALMDVTNVAKALCEAGYCDGLTMHGTFALQDAYGNTSEEMVVGVVLRPETLEKINWESFRYDGLYDVADVLEVDPVLRD